MATIQNQAVIQKLIDDLELYPALEKMPTELADKILPVFQVNEADVNVDIETNDVVKRSDTSNNHTKTLTVPAGKKWKVKHGSIKYVCSADVGGRDMEFYIYDETGTIAWKSVGGTSLTANQTGYWHLVATGGQVVTVTGIARYHLMPFPPELILKAGWSINFKDLGALTVNDNIDITLVVDEEDD